MMAPMIYLDTLINFRHIRSHSYTFHPGRHNLCVQIVRPSTYGRAANYLPGVGVQVKSSSKSTEFWDCPRARQIF
jgi:hypothetical protein